MSCLSLYRPCSPGGSSQVTSFVCSAGCKCPSDHLFGNSCHPCVSMTRNTGDYYVIQSHVDKHVHLTNCIHLKNRFHVQKHKTMEDRHPRELPLMRELTSLSRSKSLRDPSTCSIINSPQRRSLSERIDDRDGIDKVAVRENERVGGDRNGGIQRRDESKVKERARGNRARRSKQKESRGDERSREDVRHFRQNDFLEVEAAVGEVVDGASRWDGNVVDYIGGGFGDKARAAKSSQACDQPKNLPQKCFFGSISFEEKEQAGIILDNRDAQLAVKASHGIKMPPGTLNFKNEYYGSSARTPRTELRQSGESKDVEAFSMSARNCKNICSKISLEDFHTLSSMDSIDDLSLLGVGQQKSDGESAIRSGDGEISPLAQRMVALRLRLRPRSQSPLLARNTIRKCRKNINSSRKLSSTGDAFKAIVNETPVNSGGRISFSTAEMPFLPASEEDSETRNGCGIPWNWSRLPKHRGKNCLDSAGRRLYYGYPDFSLKAEGTASRAQGSLGREVGIPAYQSDCSVSSLDSDPESLPLIMERDLSLHQMDTTSFPVKIKNAFKNTLSPIRNSGTHSGERNNSDGVHGLGDGFGWMEFSSSRMERIDDGRQRGISQKYRPKSFKDVVGQTFVVQALSNAILKEKVASLYIFQGPRGTGKTCTARIFACALVCLAAKDLEPCGSCRECVNLTMGNYMDVVEVDSTSLNMKQLLDYMLLPPPSARFKICIIDECHLLTVETWTILLRSLEEPPAHVVFILVTSDPEHLPRTATSRCQKFIFSKINSSNMISRLQELARKESVEVEQDALEVIALRADGSLRDAETTLDQLCLLGSKVTLQNVQELAGLIPEEKLLELLDMAMSGQTVGTVKITRELLLSGVEALALISQLATVITNILAGSCNYGQLKTKKGLLGRKNLRKKELSRLQLALKILSDSEKQIRASNDQRTWLTASLLQFAPDPTLVSKTSSAGTSVTRSIVAVSDTSERETVRRQNAGTQMALDSYDHVGPNSLEKPGNGQSEPGSEGRRKLIATVRNSKKSIVKPRSSEKRMKGYALSMSACTAQSSHYSSSCKNSVHELSSRFFQNRWSADSNLAHEAPQIAVIDRGECSGRKFNLPIHQQKMADVWRRVLEGSRSKVVKQLLKSHGELTSLSFTEGYAVAYIEFKNPLQKLRAERSVTNIAQAFQAVLDCPVEARITLASFPMKSEQIKNSNAFSSELECNIPFQFLGTVEASTAEISFSGSKTGRKHSHVLLQGHSTAVAQQNIESENIQPEPPVEQRRTSTADEKSKVHLFNAKEVGSPSAEHLENAWVQEDYSTPALPKVDLLHFQRYQNLKDAQTGSGLVTQDEGHLQGHNQVMQSKNSRRLPENFTNLSLHNNSQSLSHLERDNLRLESRVKNNVFLCWKIQKSDQQQGNQPRRRHRQKGFFRRLVPCGRATSSKNKQNFVHVG